MAAGSNHSSLSSAGITMVPLIADEEMTFEGLQHKRLKEFEQRLHEEVRKKKHEWEQQVDKMKDEFLRLYPCDKKWGSDELINDKFIRKRRGSADVLDRNKMKTMYLDYPESGRKFKLRFDVSSFVRSSVNVTTDGDRIIVQATKKPEEGDMGNSCKKLYIRKIEKPKGVDISKLKSFLTSDGVLIVEAPLPPHTLKISKHIVNSPSHSSHGSHGSRTSITSSRSRSPSNSPGTPSNKPKYGVPTFRGEENERIFSLIVDIGHAFKPREITVQIIKDNRIQIKAKHEERTSERMSKAKFFKEYELPERIETYSMRAGLTDSGILIVGAFGKGHTAYVANNTSEEVDAVAREINSRSATPCNVLDLAVFPPANLTSLNNSSISSS